MLNILKLLPLKNSLYETVMVSANDTLVNLFLDQKIAFIDIQRELLKILKNNEFLKLRKIQPNRIGDIIKLNNYVRSKILKKVYKIKNVKKST
jgi:1-deoxy-D-xylulose-5-phosphate reductoisomerase